jgi:hypothetical protein
MNLIARPPLVLGRIEAFTIDEHGRERILLREHNTVQYEGFDALGKIMSGELSVGINGMYFQFEDGGAGTGRSVASREITAAQFLNLGAGLDFVRTRLGEGITSATEVAHPGLYNSNQIVFSGIAASGDVGEANSLVFNAGDAVEMAALVVAPDWDDNTQDMVYAAWAPGAPLVVPATGGFGLRWTVIFAHSWT